MSNVERWVKESDIQRVAEEAARAVRCESHRCRPSRWGWGTVVGLLAYTLYLHSVQIGERAEWRGAFVAKIRENVLGEARAVHQQVLEEARAEVAQQLQAIPPLLARAERLQWALTTSDLERDLELKQVVEALQAR